MAQGHVKIEAPFFNDVIGRDCDFHKSFVLTGFPGEQKVVIENHPFNCDDLVEVTVIIRPIRTSGLFSYFRSILKN